MARKFAKKCAARSGFFSVYQSNLLHAFFIFTLPSPSSWLLQLPSSVTMQNNFWYATISLKSRRFDGKRATKTTSAVTRQQRGSYTKTVKFIIMPCLLQFLLNTGVHLPSRILLVRLISAFRSPTSSAYIQSLIQICSTGRKPVIFPRYITNQQLL